MNKNVLIGVIAILVLLGLFMVFSPDDDPAITVASKMWTEQFILGEILYQYLEAEGYPVEDQIGLGETDILRPAIETGEIDVYWEYTGTVLVTVMGEEEISESEKAYQMVRDWDIEENNLVWLDYAPADNTYTLMVREDWAEERGLVTISDLGDYMEENPDEEIRLALNEDFWERPDGIPGLQELYGFEFDGDQAIFMEIGLTYGALNEEEAEVAMGFATDGRIPAFDFLLLEDDLGFFPAYNVTPVIRAEILETYPGLEETINRISPRLDMETVMNMNMLVDVEGQEPENVARDWLQEEGLID